MNIVAILGSPHGMKGNTGKLLGGLREGAERAGAETKLFSLSELQIQPCRACDVCHRTGECGVRDDFRTVRDALLAAQGVILASPNYMFSVTAQTKALMDRCCGPMHCQALDGKHAAAVVTSGGGASDEVERYLLRFLRAMGCWTVGSVSAEARQLMQDDQLRQRQEAASSLGSNLVEAIRAQRTYPEQEAERRAFFERMKTLVAMRQADWKYEYQYWKRLGRL